MNPTNITPDVTVTPRTTSCQRLDRTLPSGKYIGNRASAPTTPGTQIQLLNQFHHSGPGTQWPPATPAKEATSPVKFSSARTTPMARMIQPTRLPAARETINAPTLA